MFSILLNDYDRFGDLVHHLCDTQLIPLVKLALDKLCLVPG